MATAPEPPDPNTNRHALVDLVHDLSKRQASRQNVTSFPDLVERILQEGRGVTGNRADTAGGIQNKARDVALSEGAIAGKISMDARRNSRPTPLVLLLCLNLKRHDLLSPTTARICGAVYASARVG